MSRRVLVVSYFFPPIGGVGVQRTLKFVEHLPAAGWQPTVVAPRGAAYRVMDPALTRDLDPALEVHRALCIEPAAIRAAARTVVRRLRGRGVPPTPGPGAGRARDRAATVPTARHWLNEAWRRWVETCFVPDEQMAWVPAAALTARSVHGSRPVDVIFSSSPPASVHLAAGLAAALTGRAWVADFRDPWVGNAFSPPRSRLRRAAERWMERWVIRRADRVVFATPGLRARYAERYPRRAERFVVIPNGYDRAELGGPATRPRAGRDGADPFRLLYAGSVYGERELETFLDGLARAIGRNPTLRDRLRVDFVGWMSVPNERLVAERLPELSPTLTVHGFRPRSEALGRLRECDASLLLLADGPDRDLFVGAKLFESIGLDRPVLAMAPPGDTRTILGELEWGIVADPTPDAVADALLRLVDGPVPERSADPEGRYERRRLAARLAEVLEEAALSARPAPA